MSERKEFDELVAAHKPCSAIEPGGGGCACMGGCLGHHLGALRKKYDPHYTGVEHWWSDQLHGSLLKRPGDSGRAGAPLTAENYWTGAR